MSACYRIGWKTLLPLGLLLVLLLGLLILSVIRGEAVLKILLVAGILLPVLLVLLASLRRRVVLDEEGVRVVRVFDEKYFRWDELTSLEAVAVRGRAFVTLCAGEDFAILSNSYGDFTGLVRALADRLPESVVSPEAKRLLERQDSVMAGVFPLWFGVVALLYILWHMLLG
ncbi:PH (Pleckstrin Homology) domain-containing protein [Geothermobacter ehrlichii]|uniref:PH (Pleckstrin Homology) domain-containing protein n=1 Tax=Geothermobacter ehrlichii TaxID=213224 RepID=A0A5D3WHH7_9BACT|nr:PH domain-containing protein [Geothermobacter ehrlichii]TYO96658.1 PH (Pleckstrin Homology) domain-containing protein [Geothermobacter ehrlichii]